MANLNPVPHNTFSSSNQPRKRGRRRNKFDALKKQEKLSKSDVQTLCSLILTSEAADLSNVLARCPCILTETLIAQVAQDRAGYLSRPTKTTKVTKKTDDKGSGTDETTYECEHVRSMDAVKWMVEQVIGKPTQQVDVSAEMRGEDYSDESREDNIKRIEELMKKAEHDV
jgi:hypothetical protein